MTRIRLSGLFCSFALAMVALACTPASPPVTTVPAPTPVVVAGPTPAKEVHWFRNSAEMRGLYLEVYRLASAELDKLAAGNAPQTWAVILDADETIIDNSPFEKQMADEHTAFSETAWSVWVGQGAAAALPGAVDFTRMVHRLGGRVVIVTNRDDKYCGATRANIQRDSIEADLVLCRTTTGDKNPRFEAVAKGTASPSLGALKVLMWMGDNIQDFPNLSQKLRDGRDADFDLFGRTYFLLPNPMYGSWEKQPYR